MCVLNDIFSVLRYAAPERDLPSLPQPLQPVEERRCVESGYGRRSSYCACALRLKIIPNAFGEKPVLKLMFAAMIRAAERWRPIKVSAFERRQMQAVREELDHEYEAQTGLAKQPSTEATADNLSSSSRT